MCVDHISRFADLNEEVVYDTGVVGQRGSPWQHVTTKDFLIKPVCRVITVNGLFCVRYPLKFKNVGGETWND